MGTNPDVSSCQIWCDCWDNPPEVRIIHLQLHINYAVNTMSVLKGVATQMYRFIRCECQLPSVMIPNESGQIPRSRARSQPPGRAAAHDGEHRTHAGRTCPPRSDTLPGVFLCPVSTASPLPGCSQVVLLASSLLREEGEIIQFSAALLPPNTKRAEPPGAAVPGGVLT